MLSISGKMDAYSAALGAHIADELQAPKKARDAALALQPLIKRQAAKLADAKVASGNFSPAITGKLLAKNAGDALQEVMGTAASASVVAYASAMMSNEEGSTRGHIAQAAANSLTLATTSLIRSTMGTLLNKSTLDELDAEIETYKNLKKSTLLEGYPADIQKAVKALDNDIDKAINGRRPSEGAVWLQQKIRHREMVLLARPTEVKPFTNFADPAARKKFYKDLNALVKDYPSLNSSTIETLVQRIAANSQSDRPDRSQAYIYGPGGVGKTRLVNLIAKALNAPLVEVNINGKEIRSLMGQPYPAAYAAATKPDDEVIGELPLKMIAAGYANPIIFIDEMKLTHGNINDLKLLLDPAKTELKIGGYDASVDWSRATILVGSNDALTDGPMQTRLSQIVIGKASPEAKLNVANKIIEQAVKGYKDSMGSLGGEAYKRLLSTCKTRIDQLVALDTENFAGVRFLESSAQNMVHFVASGLLQEQPKTMQQIERYLEIQYAQAKGRATPGDELPPAQALGKD